MIIHKKTIETIKAVYPDYDFVLPGLPAGKVGILHSIGGVGKSFLSMQAGFQVAAGGSCDFEFNAMTEARPGGQVLYFSFEDEWRDFGRRAQAFFNFYANSEKQSFIADIAEEYYDIIEVDQPVFCINNNQLKTCNDYQQIRKIIIEKMKTRTIRLMIFDTLTRVHLLDENSNADMSQLINFFERLAKATGAAVLLVHHDNKAGMSNRGDRDESTSASVMRGASALSSNTRWHASMRTMSIDEAKERKIDNDDRRRYVRINLDKTSYSAPQGGAWLQRNSGGVLTVADFEKTRFDDI